MPYDSSVITPLNDPACWTAAQLQSQQADWHYIFSPGDLAEIDAALKRATRRNVDLAELTLDDFPLDGLAERLRGIGESLENGVGITMMRGLPVKNYSEDDLKIIFAGLGRYLGTLLPQSTKGERVGLVRDGGDKLKDTAARGTRTSDRLPFHTDRSDAIGLLCLRTAIRGGESYLVSAPALHNAILRKRPDLAEVLYQPFYHRRTAWEAGGGNDVYALPVFTRHQGYFAARYLRHFIQTAQELPGTPRLTELQIEALDLIDSLCLSPELLVRIPFEPGDIQWVNNFVTLHGRAAFDDTEEPEQKRLLYRLWLSTPNSRPLAPDFSAIYGRTEAGALRGGAMPPRSDAA